MKRKFKKQAAKKTSSLKTITSKKLKKRIKKPKNTIKKLIIKIYLFCCFSKKLTFAVSLAADGMTKDCKCLGTLKNSLPPKSEIMTGVEGTG
jgi:hypothetical protein